MSRNEKLIPVERSNRFNGFKNLLLVELREWWSSKSWIWTTLLWVAIANGITFLTLMADSEVAASTALNIFFLFLGFFPPIETILIMQGSIVEERNAGTVSWVLSKPISRQSFILAKWLGNSIFLLLTTIVIPGFIGYFELSLLTNLTINPLTYLFGLGVLGVYHLFFINFTLYLGTFKEKAAAVAGLPMIFNFAQQFLQMIPFASYFLPLTLILNQTGGSPLIVSIILEDPSNSWLPLLSTMFFVVIFLLFSIWTFEKEEL